MLEKILNSRNIERALRAVERNQGSGGIDDMQSDELRPFVNAHRRILVNRLLEGSYEPSPVLHHLANGNRFTIILTNRPIPDRYVGWCERTGSQIMATFLLDYRPFRALLSKLTK